MTRALLALADGLAAVGITHVALERPGEDWRPVSNRWEGDVTVFLVNAAHVKPGPGRKTDTADARWLAQLRRYGLLQARFIPPPGQRDLRELTRYRTKLVPERSREVKRGQGVVERANSKLAAVATDSRGVSGRAILAALIQGRAHPATRAELATGRMRPQIPRLEQALAGRRREHHRRRRTRQVAHIAFVDEQLAARGAESPDYLRALDPGEPPAPPTESPGGAGEAARAAAPDVPGPPRSVVRAVTVLDTIPGGDPRGAERLVAEWGTDRRRCGTASRLSAWTGVAPGHDESAGKRRAGKTRPGNHVLRAGLTPLAHAAARTQGPDLSVLDQRLAARRGQKRAIIAVAPASVVSAFQRLSRQEPSQELGANYIDEHRRHHLVDRLTRRIERLGDRVHLEPVPAA